MKRIFFVTTFTLAIGAAMLCGLPGNAKPKPKPTEPTITCNDAAVVCATIKDVVVYGTAVIKPLAVIY